MEKQEYPQQGKRNRAKGHNAERFYAKEFRDMGFDKCRTSREGSRLLDNCGVDLMFLPFLVQIKAGKQRALNTSNVLSEMKVKLEENFPKGSPEILMPKILIHHKDVGRGKEKTVYHQLVTLTFEDFVKLITQTLKND